MRICVDPRKKKKSKHHPMNILNSLTDDQSRLRTHRTENEIYEKVIANFEVFWEQLGLTSSASCFPSIKLFQIRSSLQRVTPDLCQNLVTCRKSWSHTLKVDR